MEMDFQFLALTVVLLLFTGAAAGVLAGLLGVGGGIVIVPVLFWLAPFFKVDPMLSMHIAVATSLATIVATSISSARAHYRKGVVDLPLLRLWLPGIAIGAASGGLAAKFLNGEALRLIFGIIALIVSVTMVRKEMWVISESLPKSRAVNGVISYVVGGFSALMGIGGGTLSVPVLSMFGFPIHNAVGTASSFGVAIAASAVGFYVWAGWNLEGLPGGSFGYVNWPAGLIIAAVTVFAAPMGAKFAHAMPKLTLRRCFALFLAITGIKMIM